MTGFLSAHPGPQKPLPVSPDPCTQKFRKFGKTAAILPTLAFLSAAWIGRTGSASAAEPMMDSGVFGVSRIQAVNQIREGKFSGAVLSEERALKIVQDRVGPVHPSLVPILNDLASLHRYLGEYGKAEEEAKWGLALMEKNMGPQDLSVADSKEHLAALYNDLGRFQEAEILEKEVLSTRRESAEDSPLSLVQTLWLLGKIEINLRNGGLAQSFLEKAVATQDKSPLADPALTLHLLNSLAESYRLEGLLPKTESTLQGLLELAQKNFPANDVHVADALENLGDFYRSQKQEEKAKPFYDSALNIVKPLVGTYREYPALPYMKQLARAYQGVGNLQAAGDLWKDILKTEKGVFGLDHPQVALDLMKWGEVETALGQNTLARGSLKQSIEILNYLFKDGHPLLDQAKLLLGKAAKSD
jgi:tetratricopeptide (TPR) repeat protein